MKESDSYQRYLRDISMYPRITLSREQELAQIIQTGKEGKARDAAMSELIHANLRLVIHCRKEFDKYQGASRIAPMDLIAEGNVGLMKAACHYQPGAGDDAGGPRVRFSTYACKCIKSHMLRAIKKARFIHIPEHHFSYWSEMDNLQREHGNTLSDTDLCDRMELTEDALSYIKHSANSAVCMLEDLGGAEQDSGWNDFVADKESVFPDEEAGRHDLRAFLFQEMESLNPRARQIISMLYFNEKSPTLKEIAGMFGISGERCRQICVQGLGRMKRQMFTRRHGIAPGLASEAA